MQGEYGYDAGGERFLVRAGSGGIRAGQQVTSSYNDITNDDLLQHYGFVERGCPHDVYMMPSLLQRIRAAAQVPHSRLQLFSERGSLKPLDEVRLILYCSGGRDAINIEQSSCEFAVLDTATILP